MSSSHVEHLESLLHARDASAEPALKAALLRVSSEMKERIRQGSPASVAFVSDALRALCKIKGVTHASVRMSCLFDSAFFLVTNGCEQEALLAVKELQQLANRSHQRPWVRKAHSLCGLVNAELGHVADAVISYSKALTVARSIGDLAAEVAVLQNLGVALNYGGLYREAIPCLEKVVSLVKTDVVMAACAQANSSPLEHECGALTNLAQSHYFLEEFEEGFLAISECLHKSTPPHDALTSANLAIREFTCVQLALELGKIETARQHSQACAKYGGMGGRRAQSLAQVSHGLCEVYGGNLDRGLGALELVRDASEDLPSVHLVALNSLVRAYDAAGRPEQALFHLREMLNSLSLRRERGILALLSLPGSSNSKETLHPADDLRALKYKEAQLRAKVAENEAINSRVEMLERLAVAADLKEEASGEHGYRVGKLSSLLAERLKWTRDACFALELAARLHDIGKIGVPDRILFSSGELKDAERHFVSTHAVIGAELLAKSNIPQLRIAEDIARHHHEWWDGSGYPSKLAGQRIPIHARIVALADVFDALTHGRPFAKPWPIEKALLEIRSRRGTQFDPDLTDHFIDMVRQVAKEHTSLDGFLGREGHASPFLQARNKIRQMLAEERLSEAAAIEGNQTRH